MRHDGDGNEENGGVGAKIFLKLGKCPFSGCTRLVIAIASPLRN